MIRDGRCVTVDAESVWAAAAAAQQALLDRAGITVPHVWPHLDARAPSEPRPTASEQIDVRSERPICSYSRVGWR